MNPDITIRRTADTDLSSIQLLLSTCLLEMDNVPADNFIVAEITGKIVGIAAEINCNYPEIHTVAVHPSYRSKGIGSKLVDYILRRQPDGRDKIYVQTFVPEFFEKLGFLKLYINGKTHHDGYVFLYYTLQ